jgi:hypothetical protein
VKVCRNQADRVCWAPSCSGIFEVKSYYKMLSLSPPQVFPWKSISKAKVPPQVAFFVSMATHGRILTMDNLRKCHICIVEWWCLCKTSGEPIDHLLLHCAYV